MRFLINVHLNDGLPDDRDELLNELEGIADDLLRTFQNMDNRQVYFERCDVTAAAASMRRPFTLRRLAPGLLKEFGSALTGCLMSSLTLKTGCLFNDPISTVVFAVPTTPAMCVTACVYVLVAPGWAGFSVLLSPAQPELELGGSAESLGVASVSLGSFSSAR